MRNAGDGFTFPNHNFGLTDQMNYGVRGLMLDVYDNGGVATVYHSTNILGSQPLSSNLAPDKISWMPTFEIVLSFLVLHRCEHDGAEFHGCGLMPYLHTKPWATLGQLSKT